MDFTEKNQAKLVAHTHTFTNPAHDFAIGIITYIYIYAYA